MRIAFAFILAALVLFIIPAGSVGAWDFDTSQGCCQYEGCCRELCCELFTKPYAVSYLERVETGLFTPWGTPMYTSKLVTVYVEARNRQEAAELLGLKAGYSAFVLSLPRA